MSCESTSRPFCACAIQSVNARKTIAKSILFLLTGLLVLSAATSSLANLWQQHDFQLYWTTAENLRKGQWPCIDFNFEYPPLAALIFAIPRFLGVFWMHDEGSYTATFTLEAAILTAAATIPLAAIARLLQLDVSQILRRYIVLSLLMFTVILSRYDIVPAVATLLAILCLLKNRPWLAGALLGFAVAAKLYPIVLLGIFLARCISHREMRAGAKVLLSTILVAALPFVPYLLRGSTAFVSFLRYHEQRGLQVESLPAGLILLAGKLHWTSFSINYDFGAYHVHSPAAGIFLAATPILMATACLAMTLIAYRRMREDVLEKQDSPASENIPANVYTLIEASVAMLLLFMAANKVFSPQYFIWILPLAPLLRRRVFSMVLAIIALTIIQYPFLYWRLREADLDAVILLNLRNALVVATIVSIATNQLKRGAQSPIAPPSEITPPSPALSQPAKAA